MKSSTELTLDARLGYKNKDEEDWKELANSTEVRQLKCDVVKSCYSFSNFGKNCLETLV